jgi:DNA primase
MSNNGPTWKELEEELDLESWFDRESLSYKLSRGSSGMQINAEACPVQSCGDKRSRVYLNAESGVGNCFVCNTRFRGKLSFIHTYLHGDPDEKDGWRQTREHVVEALKDQGWRPKRLTTAAVEVGEVKLPLSFPLPTADGRNLQYLETRGIDADLAKYFHLRFCIEGWWNYQKDDGSQGGQKFDNRVIIPVFDLDGELKTFQGRDITGTSDEKYRFPKGLPGTGKYLYNGQNALRAKRACAGEGAFDVFSIKKALDTQVDLRDVAAVGTFGKHLSYGSLDGDDQLGRILQLKAHGLEELTFMWDGEPKVISAVLEAADKVRKIGVRSKIALLPYKKDPNEVLPEVVCEAFWKAHTYTPALAMKWMLKNPYADAEAAERRLNNPVRTDLISA